MSDFWMANTRTSWIPSLSSPIKSGLKSSSGARNREGPICRVKGQLNRRCECQRKQLPCLPDSKQMAMKTRLKIDPMCHGPEGTKTGLLETRERNKQHSRKLGLWHYYVDSFIHRHFFISVRLRGVGLTLHCAWEELKTVWTIPIPNTSSPGTSPSASCAAAEHFRRPSWESRLGPGL